MKRWILEKFLPMWAKETLLADNRELSRQIKALRQENKELSAYLRGLETGIRSGRRVNIYTGGKE